MAYILSAPPSIDFNTPDPPLSTRKTINNNNNHTTRIPSNSCLKSHVHAGARISLFIAADVRCHQCKLMTSGIRPLMISVAAWQLLLKPRLKGPIFRKHKLILAHPCCGVEWTKFLYPSLPLSFFLHPASSKFFISPSMSLSVLLYCNLL